jgi:hypothetical protein
MGQHHKRRTRRHWTNPIRSRSNHFRCYSTCFSF